MAEKIRIYNSPEEVGVRILLILNEFKKKMSLQRIMYYDYFSLHLSDIDSECESLHPDNPKHSSEIAIKRTLIIQGLNLMISKGLLNVEYSKTGIYYKKNHLTSYFVNLFQNNYVDQLKSDIQIVNEKLSNRSDNQIYKYISKNIGSWTGEFEENIRV